MNEQQQERDVDEFLRTARERFDQSRDEEADIRTEARLDIQFVCGEQWDEKIKKARLEAGRPALTFNKLGGPVNQVANEARQNKPNIKFTPSDDPADKDTALILDGLGRAVQYDSDADAAYEIALKGAASGSFGYFRFTTEYCSPRSFDLDLKIKAVLDPFSVYGVLVPSCRQQKSRWAFVVETISHEEFKARYPNSRLVSFGFDSDYARGAGDWITDHSVQIAEYWWIETETKKIALLEGGQVVDVSEVPEGVTPKQTRTERVDVVKCCLTNGVEILEDTETTWPGETIPIVLVPGDLMIAEGKIRLFSLVRFSRDPQQLVNFAKSRIAEILGTSPVSPWIAAEGQLEGHETEWQQAHVKPTAALQYKPVSLDGELAPAPQRQTFEPPIAALSAFVAQEEHDIKSSTNIYDPSLGAQSNETSGKAINARQRQSSLSNLHFIDNLNRSHRVGGRIMAEVIPKIYDGERMVRILGEDEKDRIVKVNAIWQDPDSGKTVHYNLTAGKYDVKVSTGPGYTTRRQEAFELLLQIAQAYPQLVSIIGDIIMRNSDIPGADEAAERLHKMLPPQLLAKDGEAEQQIPPAAVAQIEQMKAVIEQLQAALQESKTATETKQLETQSRERIEAGKREIEALRIEADLLKAQAQLDHKESVEVFRRDTGVMMQRLSAVVDSLRSQPAEPAEEPTSDQSLPAAA